MAHGKDLKRSRVAKDSPASIGQLTSAIKNKQARSEAYSKLKHLKQVCTFLSLHVIAHLAG